MDTVKWHCCLYMVTLLGSLQVTADDAYLKVLEGEAEALELDPSGQLHGNKAEERVRDKGLEKRSTRFGWGAADIGDELPSGMEKAVFDAYLEENYYGTYIFYQRLNSVDKNTVFYRYSKAESASFENVRKNILDLMKR